MIEILLVEDDLLAQMSTKMTLKTVKECNIDITSCGEQAIDMCNEKVYDLIFMDIGLSGVIDGYTTSQKIKKDGKNKATPIVIITANGSEQTNAERLSDIISHFAVKPLSIEIAQTIFQKFISPVI